jgi:hypothetical protein
MDHVLSFRSAAAWRLVRIEKTLGQPEQEIVGRESENA